MSNGHSWSSIQEYTLSEIGIFLRVIVQEKRQNEANKLYYSWMGSNITLDGLKDMLKRMSGPQTPQVKEQITEQEVSQEWRRLAAFMSGKK